MNGDRAPACFLPFLLDFGGVEGHTLVVGTLKSEAVSM